MRALLTTAAVTGLLLLGVAGSASAAEPGHDECSVPGALRIVAAEVDPDSLEGCDYFEDPAYHDNRRGNGTYTPNGVFSILFR